jgi:hypothetical protein
VSIGQVYEFNSFFLATLRVNLPIRNIVTYNSGKVVAKLVTRSAQNRLNSGINKFWWAAEARTLDPLIMRQGQRGPKRNIDKKVQLFRGWVIFSSTMEGVCSAQVQAHNKHSRGLKTGTALTLQAAFADIKQPSAVSRGILRTVDWKSTIIDNLFTFLLFNVFFDHFIGDSPRANGKISRAQKCRPQNLLRRLGYSCSKTRELIPLSHCMIWLTSWFGRYERNTCTWSRATLPEIISSSCSMAICLMRSRTRIATSPVSTGLRYFGTHTTWTLRSLFVYAPNLYLRT